jgi:hypothetical protein
MFANTQAGGLDQGFPDVCLTPAPPSPAPVPVPYPNAAAAAMGTQAVYHVLFSCAPAHNLGTNVPTTSGDNAGIALGVSSGTVMGPSRHVTGALSVLVGGKPATRLTSSTMQNSTNCVGARLVPSQTKVLILAR